MSALALALGGAGLGNLYRAIADEDAIAAVHAALGAGFVQIDTAPYYGHGLSEMRIGAALRSWRGARPLLSSKVGRVLDAAAGGETGAFGFANPAPFRPRFDYSRDGVRRSLEGSLQRLGVARLDMALIHDIGAQTHGAAHGDVMRTVFDETLPALHDAQREGLVGEIGLGVNEWQVCVEVLNRAPIDCILIAGRYTLMEQPALSSGLLQLCQEKRVAVLAAGVFNSGLLAQPPDASSPYNYQTAPAPIVARARALWEVCTRLGVEPQAAALHFAAAHPAVRRVVVGARTAAEVRDCVRWSAVAPPPALWQELKRLGFVAEDAPTPRLEKDKTCA